MRAADPRSAARLTDERPFVTDREPGTQVPGPHAPWAAPAPPWAPPQQTSQPATPVRPHGGQAPWVPASSPGAPMPPAPPPRGGMPGGAATWAALVVLLTAAAVLVAVLLSERSSDGGTADTDRSASPADERDRATDEDADAGPDPEIVPELPSGDEVPEEPSAPAEPAPRGDLGLAVPISSPTCDGSWLVFLGAATDAAAYASDVSTLLAGHPEAQYTLTQGGCSSMRQQLDDGSLIYAVYVGPYPDQASACVAKAGLGDAAYVKRMDNSTPAEQLWQC